MAISIKLVKENYSHVVGTENIQFNNTFIADGWVFICIFLCFVLHFNRLHYTVSQSYTDSK